MKKRKFTIITIVLICCFIMAMIDIMKVQYLVKSIYKILLFLIFPIAYSMFDKEAKLKLLLKPNRQGLKIAFLSGISVFIIIIGAYLLLGRFFNLSNIIPSLSKNVGVSKSNFLWIAIYISFVNSLLEEFFFRGFSFFSLKKYSSRRFAYIFSSLVFAIYHVAIMIGWFDILLFVLTLSALFVGGVIFNYFNEKYENIYISWLIHMFANFAINYIGFVLFDMI